MAKKYYVVVQRGLPMDVCSYRSSAIERANQLSTKDAPATVIEVEENKEKENNA